MLDLDDFRTVNNDARPPGGRRPARASIATDLVRAGRDTDLVFRYGGDEFTFLLPHTDAAGALQVAERARAGGRQRATGRGQRVDRRGDLPGRRPDRRVRSCSAADRACFVAKRSGRDRIATAAEGLALAAEFSLQEPTPVDPPTPPDAERADHGRDAIEASLMAPTMRVRLASFGTSPWSSSPRCVAACVPNPANRHQSDGGVAAAPRPSPTDARRPHADPVLRPPDTDPAARPSSSTPSPRRHAESIAKLYETDGRSIAYWNRLDLPVARPGFRLRTSRTRRAVGWMLQLIPTRRRP